MKTVVDGFGRAGRQAGFCPGLAAQTDGVPVRLDPGTLQRIDLLGRTSESTE